MVTFGNQRHQNQVQLPRLWPDERLSYCTQEQGKHLDEYKEGQEDQEGTKISKVAVGSRGLQLRGAQPRLRAHPPLVIKQLAHGVDLQAGHKNVWHVKKRSLNFGASELPARTNEAKRGDPRREQRRRRRVPE